MNTLYPLKFEPIFKDYIWGGSKLKKELNKKVPANISCCAESWEISSMQNNITVVTNGFLAGNNLQELIEVYMGDLVGDKVYEKFGDEFPLLVKLIDATDTLSIQVHPNDEVAKERHHAYGKTEMWYIIDSEPDSEIITGFSKKIDKSILINALEKKTFKEILNIEKASKYDAFFLPAGRIHAIGKGILLAEIQQASDITYRLYDWDRKDKTGKHRELHTDLALDVIDYKHYESYKITAPISENVFSKLVDSEFFQVNRLFFNKPIEREYHFIDSFVIYVCIDGKLTLDYGAGELETLTKGETILIPAELKELTITPVEKAMILEVFIK